MISFEDSRIEPVEGKTINAVFNIQPPVAMPTAVHYTIDCHETGRQRLRGGRPQRRGRRACTRAGAGRHVPVRFKLNVREEDAIDIMAAIADGTVGKRLRYRELIADSGLPSGARP